ncbi:CcdB family protein [Pseudocitrobacter vendiensis]|uniref:Toxin CcdB n=1 Tax=Pseudocitrobacter vendiensis TaxID=2488306 RepID=A0ABN8TBH6_9ENTR|nr:CcdB family protein [Pseudocitrobacter vendiensis]CAH6660215.1 Cytotoxic protein CcdB [Pseudocitrobacter vendiensis]
MEQFCAYENIGSGKKAYPYLINLQHPIANVLRHVLVAPVVPLQQLPGKPPAKVCPIVKICGQPYAVMMHMMGSITAKELGECAADLTSERLMLRDAIDFILNGY